MSVNIPDDFIDDPGLEPEKCTLEATVVTGFESLAKLECQQKLGVTAEVSRGRIVFQVPVNIVSKVTDLRSVDNLYVIIFNKFNFELGEDKDESLNRLCDVITDCQWNKGLAAWRSITGKTDTDEPMKFRVSCHRANGPQYGGKHSFTSPEAATTFGAAVQNKFQWKADMTKFDVEVVLNVVSDQVYVCIALTKESLHRRNIVDFGWTTLRSTVAFNLLQLANIQDGEVVCDPMCGSGAIPIEGVLNWAAGVHLCGDFDPVAVSKTVKNRNHVIEIGKKNSHFDVFQWDVTRLPLATNSVDVFVTDLPFGKRSGSKTDNRVLYPKVLMEMARISRVDLGRAVLMTQDRRSMTTALQKTMRYWQQMKLLTINLGGLVAVVYLLKRRSLRVETPDKGVCDK